MTFKPTSSYKRHQKYFGAFCYSDITRYLSAISRYIKDKNISHLDEDDVEFLRYLLFDGPFGKIHISYYTGLHDRKRSRKHFSPSVRSLARYADFLSVLSPYFYTDFLHVLFKKADKSLVGAVYKHLSSDNKLVFIYYVQQYPDVIKQLPKIKLLTTFS